MTEFAIAALSGRLHALAADADADAEERAALVLSMGELDLAPSPSLKINTAGYERAPRSPRPWPPTRAPPPGSSPR
ncbi:hypothetical protein [Actinoplanes sp. NPDC023714]|uniref:hypothetical protein n=1 Tax=Actinoplanes sp. NPDC023714 TaxID=3154322 RepID=UPI0033E78CF5